MGFIFSPGHAKNVKPFFTFPHLADIMIRTGRTPSGRPVLKTMDVAGKEQPSNASLPAPVTLPTRKGSTPMQNSDASLAPIPEQKTKEPIAEPVRHVSDKNRIDPIARSSEPGRHGEESIYVPPSHLHPERSTAQSSFDNPLTASSGGSYGLDHFLDKGSPAESAAGRPIETRSGMDSSSPEGRRALVEKVKTQVSDVKTRVSERMKGSAHQIDDSVHRKPYLYALGAMGAGLLLGRFLRFSAR
jgi:hypothetical protein